MFCLDGSKVGEEGGLPLPIANQATGVGGVPRKSVLEILGGTIVPWGCLLTCLPNVVLSLVKMNTSRKTSTLSLYRLPVCVPPNLYVESLKESLKRWH